jgi:hypothetical protein
MHEVQEQAQGSPRRREGKVGRIIDRLAGDGWLVLDDVHTRCGKLDYVLVGPAGILTVSTSGERGRVRAHATDRLWLGSASAKTKWLAQVAGTSIEPLFVFGEARVAPGESQQWGVWVLSARRLRRHVRRRDKTLSPDEVKATFERLQRALDGQVDEPATTRADAPMSLAAEAMAAYHRRSGALNDNDPPKRAVGPAKSQV